MHRIIQLICFVLVLTTFLISYGSGESFHEGEAKVELIKKRLRRSTGAEGEDFEKLEDHPRNYEYDVRVTAFGISHDLKLIHAGSIFSTSFKYNEIYTNESGHVVWKDITPSLEKLVELEDNIYHDVSTNTVVKVEHLNTGEINLNGIVNHANIRPRRSLQDFFSSNHTIQFPKIIQPPEPTIRDYIELGPPKVLIPRQGVDPNTIPPIEPELAFVIEKTLSDLFATHDDLLEYMAIMINAVNSLYSLTPEPKIKFTIVALHRITDKNSQPFMAPAKVGDEYDLFEILGGFEDWAKKNQKLLGPHDISPLQLGVNFTAPGLKGLARRTGACQFNIDMCEKVAVCSGACPSSQDLGGRFSGAFTLAHELGHSLGAPHDGEQEAVACPFSDGFIMSYKGWGTLNHFKFSPCSLFTIRQYASTNDAKCLFESTGLPIIKNSSLESGNNMTGDTICKKEISDEASVFDPSPDDSCRNTICKIPTPQAALGFGFGSPSIPVGNNAPCGEKGKCRNGYCVGQGTPKTLDQLCSMTFGSGWTFDQASSDESPFNDVCSRSGALLCSGIRKGQQTVLFISIGLLGIDLPVGTICHPAKNLICFNEACVAQDSISHPEKECILHTKKMEAVKTSLNCSKVVNCTYGTESELLTTQGSSEDAACDSGSGISSGICHQGQCSARPPPPVEPTSGGHPKSLLKICSELMKDPNAKIISPFGGLFGRDKLCKGLTCLKSDGTTNVGIVPDGTVCGPLRTCKNGKCLICAE